MVAKWVDLRLIFEFCARETGQKGWGRFCKQWWRQKTAEWQLKTMLKDILSAE